MIKFGSANRKEAIPKQDRCINHEGHTDQTHEHLLKISKAELCFYVEERCKAKHVRAELDGMHSEETRHERAP